MSIGIAPLHSKTQVTKAGNRIREGNATAGDLEILENWRASHSHVMNTFQANLRRRTRDYEYLVGQRLKRRVTIIDKLTRQPGMNLSRMHDIAGCRVIFPSVSELVKFRSDFIDSRAKHERLTAERDQFNYLENPKHSGYRGIHDVYRYQSYAQSSEAWSGLLIEVQYRTRAQHAWATAVEIADLLTKSRGKFSEGTDEYQEFFQACSEIIARTIEQSTSCCGHLSDSELLKFFEEKNKATNLLEILSRTNTASSAMTEGIFKKKLNVILEYPFNTVENQAYLKVRSFKDTRRAIEEYEKLETESAGIADVVLVRAEDSATLMKVFQNYFTDARDFVQYVRDGLNMLSE